MDKLISLMEQIETTSSTNAKIDLFADFLDKNTKEENVMYLKFLSNTILPEPQKLNIGSATTISAISQITGYSNDEIKEISQSMGNLSSASEYCFENKKQMSFFEMEPQNISTVLRLFQELPTKNKVSDKITNIVIAFSDQTPKTIRYLTHFLLGGNNLSIGYKNKTLLDALEIYLDSTEKKIHDAYTFTNSIPNLIYTDLETDWKMKVHFPYKVQLADKTNKPLVVKGQHIDVKLDGGRVTLHGDSTGVSLFSRQLENATKAFPDVYKPYQDWIEDTEHEAILDSEFMMGGDFKSFGRRIKRKHDIDEFAKELPAKPHIFDILHLDGKDLIHKTLSERRKILSTLDLPEEFVIVDYVEFTSQQQLNKIYEEAIANGYEGVMVKEDVPYELNNRSTTWTKIKPTYTADLVVDDAKFGTGRNANKLSSFTLATYEGLTVGNIGIGIEDDLMDKLTEMFSNQDIVLEIAYESVQKTNKTTSGYSLRFPRVIGIRFDKSPDDATTLEQLICDVNIT